jgi:chaperone modulatory protein CbpM
MTKKDLVIVVANQGSKNTFTLHELCEICHVPEAMVESLISYDIIQSDRQDAELIFNLEQLVRAKKALRLVNDLEVNLAGAAVILDLIEELHQLRTHLQVLKRHY